MACVATAFPQKAWAHAATPAESLPAGQEPAGGWVAWTVLVLAAEALVAACVYAGVTSRRASDDQPRPRRGQALPWCAAVGLALVALAAWSPDAVVGSAIVVAGVSVVAWRSVLGRRNPASDAAQDAPARVPHDPASGRDALTHLVDRTALLETVGGWIARRPSAQGGQAPLAAAVFIDLDGFKFVNDSLGRRAGDRLICEVARRIEHAVTRFAEDQPRLRHADVSRLDGDEFAAFLAGVADEAAVLGFAHTLHETLADTVELDGQSVHVSSSIGVCLDRGEYAAADDLLRDADIAMARAKTGGRGGTRLFDAEMRVRVQSQLELQSALRLALAEGEIIPHLQPIVSLETGEPVGFEALARWPRPGRGWVSPGEFIPAAEDSGLVVPLGWSMLRQSCQALRTLRQEVPGGESLYVSVNLSRVQLIDPVCADRVREVLQETGLPPAALHLEVTESAIMSDVDTGVAQLQSIRELGVQISLDDFGTGYSSLSCLHRFPLDELKIDRSFIADATERQDFAAVVHAIVALAANLDIAVVAEGVETLGQVAQLQALGCGKGQGFFFAKPMAVSAVHDLLADGPRPLTGDGGLRTDAA
ncbi:MAG: bifunctional diguanylate cyclase/phosphodiesterase [Planctomycetota bacterium]